MFKIESKDYIKGMFELNNETLNSMRKIDLEERWIKELIKEDEWKMIL